MLWLIYVSTLVLGCKGFFQKCEKQEEYWSTLCERNGDVCEAEQDKSWSYCGENGPQNWKKEYRDCGGSSQSPINIGWGDVQVDKNMKSPYFTNYDQLVRSAEIQNNGHTVQVTPTDRINRTVTVDEVRYNLSQFHAHWGCSSERGWWHGWPRRWKAGSEHTVNGIRYAAEIHFVHMSENGRILVVAVFLKPAGIFNTGRALNPLTTALPSVMYRGQTSSITGPLNLEDILGDTGCYWRYNGSLTTPGCTEGVTWIVLKKATHVDDDQLNAFCSLKSTPESLGPNQQCYLQNNFRPIQCLKGRKILTPCF